MSDRRIFAITGSDRVSFLQNLVTNDVSDAMPLTYAALLTPQGKFIADFFLLAEADALLLDVAESHADMLLQRLTMYRLRADVQIMPTALHLHRGLGTAPADAQPDPRHETLGWRAYRESPPEPSEVDWDALHVAQMIPQTGIELTGDSYILEMGFERLNGVDFRKGCYVGQEVTARMKHKTELRKGLAKVSLLGTAEPGTPLLSEEKPAGTLHTVAGREALAYLRFDRSENLTANGAPVTVLS